MTRYEAALKYLQDQNIVISDTAMEALEDYYSCSQELEIENDTIVYNNYIFKFTIYKGDNALKVYDDLTAIKMMFEQ